MINPCTYSFFQAMGSIGFQGVCTDKMFYLKCTIMVRSH